jgi:molybdopterin converting factor small subunit
MKVRVKLYGVFRSAAKSSEIVLDVETNANIKAVVTQLASREDFQNLRQLLLDNSTSDPRPNALVLVSGREINTLRGLDTLLHEDDEVSMLPIAHGG